MPQRKDNELRTTVTAVKGDGMHFKAPMQDGREQEFTLTTQSTLPYPAVGDDVLILYGIQPASTDPDKVARFGSEPTFWVNSIEPASSNGTVGEPQGTYEKVRAAVEKSADEIAAQEKAPPQKELPQRSPTRDATGLSIEKQQCLIQAVAYYANGGGTADDVVTVAWKFYDDFMIAHVSPQHEEDLVQSNYIPVGDPDPAPPHTDQEFQGG